VLLDWSVAHHNGNSKYTHLAGEFLLYDLLEKRILQQRMSSSWGFTDSSGHIAQDKVVENIEWFVHGAVRDFYRRNEVLTSRADWLSLVPPEKLNDARLIIVNEYYDMGYEVWPNYLSLYRLQKLDDELPKVFQYIGIPKYSYAAFTLQPGFYALKVGDSVERIEVKDSEQRDYFKFTRGLLNRSPITKLEKDTLDVALKKSRNAFFPDLSKNQDIVQNATWKME
jgi:hypothetical protein